MIGIAWLGWDGSLWNLRDGKVTIASISGLRHVPFEVFTRSSSAVAGQEVTGWNAGPREVPLGINISGSSELDWWTTEAAFMRTIRPDKPGTLIVSPPVGASRRISLRLNESDDAGDESDPAEDWGSSLVLPMIADSPWYRGRQHVETFPGSGGLARKTYPGWPLYFPRSTYTGAAVVQNDGDVPSHGLWQFFGPLSRFETEVAGGVVSGSVEVPAGARLQLNTAPNEESVRLFQADGSSEVVTNQLESVDFRAVPEGKAVTVHVRVFGAGSASVVFDELFLRGF